MKILKKAKGSALIISILILSMIIVIALSITLSSLREMKNVAGESGSSKAFQMADAGVEAVMNDIIKSGKTTVGMLSHCQPDGVIRDSSYEVQLYDASGTIINCSSDGSKAISFINQIKSTGTALGQSRAIQAAVAVASGVTMLTATDAEVNIGGCGSWKATNLGVWMINCGSRWCVYNGYKTGFITETGTSNTVACIS